MGICRNECIVREVLMEVLRGDYYTMKSGNDYTIEDIFALPEEIRAELYDGEMVMLANPTTSHQMLVSWFNVEIAMHIRNKGGKCMVIPAPYGVFIKKDNRNYFQPDISVICDRERLDEKGCHGAPDWVVEIISPSSRKYDCGKKLSTYIETGVREYWIVDPEKSKVVVYRLEQPDVPQVYPFGTEIPVGILEGLVLTVPEKIF